MRRWWRTRLLAAMKQSPVSARGVAIGQFIKISIESLSISTVTCTYPLCGDKIIASLCTQANKQTVHALVHGQARRLPSSCTTVKPDQLAAMTVRLHRVCLGPPTNNDTPPYLQQLPQAAFELWLIPITLHLLALPVSYGLSSPVLV